MRSSESDQKSVGGLTRRELLKFGMYGGLATSLSPLLWLSGCSNKERAEKYNVVLISIDTLRADHLGCYGYNRETSPTLDKLASEGVLFEDASATSSWTLPSHGSLLTGLYPSRIGLVTKNHILPPNVKPLAKMLSERGLTTAAIVNSFYVSKKFGFDTGFENFSFVPEGHLLQGVAPVVIEKAREWLQESYKEQFFLFLHFFDVHTNYHPLPLYANEFARPYDGIADGSSGQLLAFRDGKVSLNDNDIKHLIDLYDAGIRQFDDQLNMLFTVFQQRNLMDKTIFIITADHGEEFFDHGGVLHGRTLYQELTHVPLIIRGPKIPRAKRIKDAVSLIDVTPTVLSLFGIKSFPELEGYDLCSLWQRSSDKPPERFIFAETDNDSIKVNIKRSKRSVRGQRYKLHYDLLSQQHRLYDLANDPQEHINIAAEHPNIVKLLRQELKNFMKKSKDNYKTVPLSPEELQRLKSLGYI